MTSGPREAESLSDLSGASKGSVDCQQTTRETAVQNSVKGWIFSLLFFFPGLCKYPEIQPKSSSRWSWESGVFSRAPKISAYWSY